jgi:hypothetical protein
VLSKTTIIDGIIHASQSEVSGVKRIVEVGYEPSAVPSYDFPGERKNFPPESSLHRLSYVDRCTAFSQALDRIPTRKIEFSLEDLEHKANSAPSCPS